MSNMKLSVKDRPAHNLPNNNFAWLTFNKIGQFLLSSVYLNNEHPEVPIRRAVRNSTHVWTQLRQCESDGVKNLIRSYIRSHSFPRTCVLSSTLRRLHSNVIITLRIHVHLTLCMSMQPTTRSDPFTALNWFTTTELWTRLLCCYGHSLV